MWLYPKTQLNPKFMYTIFKKNLFTNDLPEYKATIFSYKLRIT